MNSNKASYYLDRLNEEKESIKNTIQQMKDNELGLGQKDAISELSMIDNHPADVSDEMFEREKGFALVRNEKNVLEQIDSAIERIKKGTYGTCELCGAQIPEERLEFMPYTTRCVECEKAKSDYRTFIYDRPVEEENLSYPFGRTFLDTTENTGFDGEDSWQAVDEFNKRHHISRNYDDTQLEGNTEQTDNISNLQYKNQLPD